MAKADKYNFADAEVDYRAGSMSVNAIATKHCIPEPTLRREAKKRGWVKGLSSTKRIMVRDAMAGADLTNSLTNDEVRQNQLSAAGQDVSDMNSGLSLFRLCLASLNEMIHEATKPAEVKNIVDAGKAAIDGIRRIRGLDDLPAESPEGGIASLIAAVNGTAMPIAK